MKLHSKGKTVKMVKTVNVQEGQQHIATPQMASHLVSQDRTGQDVASQCTIPQGPDVHRLHR